MERLKKILPFIALCLVFITASCKSDQKKTEETAQDKELRNLIQVTAPEPGSEISSPLEITGQARGTWFFEGDFPIFLLDSNGNEIGVAIAIAQGEWMTEEWVPFTATMEFQAPAVGEAELVFQKSNPSDKRELDRSYRVKVKF